MTVKEFFGIHVRSVPGLSGEASSVDTLDTGETICVHVCVFSGAGEGGALIDSDT